ncbi:DUF3131 domain-containing protein [Candidatus Bathyarchaeota archaeon]|nr:DUF3131 domain-containing protein [Candidatus Bathyarchaeota archaeon]
MRVKTVAAVLTLLLLLACPVQKASFVHGEANENFWLSTAEAAWSYFQPGAGVDPETGLNYATSTFHYLTDWDLGCYISAIIDAEMLGLIQRDGKWGANYRIGKVLSFLKTRQLTDSGLPYWFYDSETSEPEVSKGPSNPSDAGRLLIALYRLKQYRPDLASDVDYIVDRTNYTYFAERCSTEGFYAYYIAHGYSLFGFNTSRVQKALGFVERIPEMEKVEVYGESLPATEITMEPILHTIFELKATQEFYDWAYKVYRVQEERYKATGKPTAFTEGAYYGPANYIYEWIVLSRDKVWYVVTVKGQPMDEPPVVYAKAAFGMHAIWPSSYTETLIQYVSRDETEEGFYEGVDEEGKTIAILTDKTNSLIINAARYALKAQKPEIDLDLSKEVVELRPGDSVDVSVEVRSTAPLEVSLQVYGLPSGVEGQVDPAEGVANFTSTLTLRVSSSAQEGTYILNVTAVSPEAGSTWALLTLIVGAPVEGYKLRIRVMDWRMENPIANATVHLGGEEKTSDNGGYVEWENVTGTVTVKVSFMGVWVSDPVNVQVDKDKTVEVQCRFFDVYVQALNREGKPVQDVKLTLSLNGRVLGSAVTNQTGYALFKDIPSANLTLTAYEGEGYTVKLGEWKVEVFMEGQVIEPAMGGEAGEKALWLVTIAVVLSVAAAFSALFMVKRKTFRRSERI